MATKRATRIKTTPVVVEETMVETVTVERPGNLRLIFLLLLLLLLLILFWYKTNTWPVAAFVNNKPIWRFSLDQQLYKQGGQQVLESMITQKLVDDELAKNKISATTEEIDRRIDEIKSSLGSSFDAALAAQGMSMDQLKDQVGVQIKIEKLLDSQASTSAEEIAQMMKDGSMDATTAAKALKQQKLQTIIQNWVDGLRTKAKVLIVGQKASPTPVPAQ